MCEGICSAADTCTVLDALQKQQKMNGVNCIVPSRSGFAQQWRAGALRSGWNTEQKTCYYIRAATIYDVGDSRRECKSDRATVTDYRPLLARHRRHAAAG